jgi:phosphohistidine swiveling domain-containing protein
VYQINNRHPPISVGNKAFNIHRLIHKGVRVPKTYAVSWEAYDRYMQDHVSIVEQLNQQLTRILDPAGYYAVRSSANIEDALEGSFAGQFKTMLRVQGEQKILMAIWSIWSSVNSPGVKAYLEILPIQQRELHMGVLVQEMVNPVVSGVAFSRNPITGEDEVIVEAVLGAGTALVQEGITPLRWVNRSGLWKSSPHNSPIETSLIEMVCQQTRQIAASFKAAVDLEWVYDGTELFWVQMREISSLINLTTYSNRIAKEVLPGMIKPLIWSINVPLINSVWVELLTELVGKNELKIDDLAKSFYYRTYFNISALGRIWDVFGMPRESLEIMMGILPHPNGQRIFKPTWRMMRLMPRLLSFTWRKWNLGKRFEIDYPRLRLIPDDYRWHNTDKHSESELLAEINRLYHDLHLMVYYNINIPILMAVYNALFNNYLKKARVDLAQFDLMAGMTEHLKYAPDIYLKDIQHDFSRLDPATQEKIKKSSYDEFQHMPCIRDFQEKVADFMARFGYLSDSGNDFSSIPWRENPDMVIQLLSQEPIAELHAAKVSFNDLKLPRLTSIWARLLYDKARKFRLYREQISSLYTLAYGCFRPYYLALGRLFSARDVLSEPEDIFYLDRVEIQEVVSTTASMHNSTPTKQLNQDYGSLARIRKAEMISCWDLQLPTLIFGNVPPVVDTSNEEKLTGVPTSRGYYSGPARIVHGLQDFNKVLPGDVLVIPYSDVSWSVLFSRAKAIVAESGGMLSHSSILAREYQIPAVVSVPGAMQLHDEMLVTVDGYRGEVILYAKAGIQQNEVPN